MAHPTRGPRPLLRRSVAPTSRSAAARVVGFMGCEGLRQGYFNGLEILASSLDFYREIVLRIESLLLFQ